MKNQKTIWLGGLFLTGTLAFFGLLSELKDFINFILSARESEDKGLVIALTFFLVSALVSIVAFMLYYFMIKKF